MSDEKKPQDPGTDFGMIDLGGDEAASLGTGDGDAAGAGSVEGAGESTPAAAGGTAAGSATPGPAVPARQPADNQQPVARPPSRYEPIEAPARPLVEPRTIKLILLVVLVLAALSGAVYGVMKWRASVAAEKAAEQERLNSRSLDNLRDQAVRSDGI